MNALNVPCHSGKKELLGNVTTPLHKGGCSQTFSDWVALSHNCNLWPQWFDAFQPNNCTKPAQID